MNRPTRSACTVYRDSGRRSSTPPPGTLTMTNCPGEALAATCGALSSTAAKLPKRRTAETLQCEVSAHS